MSYWLYIAFFILLIFVFLLVWNRYGSWSAASTTNTPEHQPSPNPTIQGKVTCYITEFDQPPDDGQGAPSKKEVQQVSDVQEEEFRVRGGGGRRGHRGGGVPGGHRGGGGMFWPWRTWPRYHWGRPWRSYWWRSYPSYVYTYPTSYYYTGWEAPIQRFTVRIGPKGDRHPFSGEGSDVGYMISTGSATGCGTSGAQLNLQRGRTYEFDIYTSLDCVTGKPRDDPFFFTTDQKGGSRSGEIFNITPTKNGTIRITITDNLPSKFYYQSATNPYVGGYVFLH